MFKFKLTCVALVSALTSTVTWAAPASHTLKSGTNVIDIERPNAAGVSHNVYTQFNVSEKGVIFNNSGTDTNHEVHGAIAKNSNLTAGSASVILNEVTSNKASVLNGFLEVNGPRADVVVVNPNGITCSGCSFVNTNKAILTTGNVTLSEQGAISKYTVTGGGITVDSFGMEAPNSYAMLMADAITLSGTINAGNALLAGGNFTYDNTTGAMTSAGKSANLMQSLLPTYSIDIKRLGGIKANSITMVGNNLGFGVRNNGNITSTNNLSMASNGTLMNVGTINGGLVTQLSSAGDVYNSGTINTNNIALINSQKAVFNYGNIKNNNQMIINASGVIQNSGTLNAANTLIINTNGTLKTKHGSILRSDNALSISALDNVESAGAIEARSTYITFGGSKFSTGGTLSGSDTLMVQSVKSGALNNGDIANTGKIYGGNTILNTRGAITQSLYGTITATKGLTAASDSLSNLGAINTSALTIANNQTKNQGTINAASGNIQSQTGFTNEGKINSTSHLTITTNNQSTVTNRGSIQSGGTLTMTGKKVINGGSSCGFLGLFSCGKGTLSADKIVVNSSQEYAQDIGGKMTFKKFEINTVE
ncbi:filamentous hemagglutinin N-terminal domain-containing protein [Leclercia sp. S52]|uniref:two-partner secretion domain-containing protein n=1 Tax=Leclercia sp. S52 TaxID=3138178 RepID=UPI00321937F9